MADARMSAARGRPRGLVKAKPQATHAKPHDAVVLPKLRLPSNNSSNGSSLEQLHPFSPRAKEIPVALPVAPRPPGRPSRPTAPPSSTVSSSLDLGSPRPFMTAWSTPRSPATEEPPVAAADAAAATSPLASFFTTDGTSLTPARLQSVEETLLAAEQLYHVDWPQLQQDNDKFFEISDTAAKHLDALQTDLPALHEAAAVTKSALADLAQDIATLHADHAEYRAKMAQEVAATIAQYDRERLSLQQAHAEKQDAMEKAHESQIQELQASYQQQLRELEAASAATERACLDEIDALKAHMATQLEQQREQAATDREQLLTDYENQLHQLRTSSEAELAALRGSSDSAYHQLLASSQKEISELKAASTDEIEKLLQASASTLAEVTDTLSSELKDTREQAASDVATLRATHEQQVADLQAAATAADAELRERHTSTVKELQAEWKYQVFSLCGKLEAAELAHSQQVEGLATRATAELTATRVTLAAENAALTTHFTQEISSLVAAHRVQVDELHTGYEMQLAQLRQSHSEQLAALQTETAAAREQASQQHDAQVLRLQDEAKLERERLELRYESELDALRCVTAEQVAKTSRDKDDTVQQLREGHAARVLALETAAREADKRHGEERELLEGQLAVERRRVRELEAVERTLTASGQQLRERASEERSRFGMRSEEVEAAVVALERVVEANAAVIEGLKRELRANDDDRQTKAATILELTFVIKSRDEEIDKLRASLLDTIQHVTTKTEILEQTTETLSTKAKELEATKAALRLESGRLSMVEEDVHQKEGMLEDSGLKIENLRLQLENLRLEMKRLQMDMKLQHEHSAGEMELKQGEIRRLHAAQLELRQKNDFHQETIVRLEAQLAAAVRQGDELRRRAELLKVETSQHLGEASQLADRLLDKDTEVVVLKGEKLALQSEVQRLQIHGNNLQSQLSVQRERLECQAMRIEDVHCQYQRRLEMTAMEKDERLKYEKHLLQLELSTVKETLKQAQDVAGSLAAARDELAATAKALQLAADEKLQLQEQLNQVDGERLTVLEQREVLAKAQDAMALRVAELEQALAASEELWKTKEIQATSLAGDATKLGALLQEKEAALTDATSGLQQTKELVSQLEDKLQSVESARREADAALMAVNEKVLALETDHVAMETEMEAMEKAFNDECEAHLRDVRDAEQLASEEAQRHSEHVTALEQELLAVQKEKAVNRQAHDEANCQLAYLVLALKQAEDAHAVSLRELKDALVVEQTKTEAAGVESRQQAQAEVDRLTAEVQAIETRLHAEEALKIQAIESMKQQHDAAITELKAASEAESERQQREIKEVHEQQLADTQAAFAARVLALETEKAGVVEAATRMAGEIDEARIVHEQLSSQIASLQRELDERERVLRENEEVLRVRKATIENVRKEMALYMEIHKAEVGSTASVDGGGEGGGGVSLEQTLALLKHQLETYANEEFHLEELPGDLTLASEQDLRGALQDTLRMRCSLSTIGRSRVLTVDDVCASLASLQRILAATGDQDGSEVVVIEQLRQLASLQASVGRLLETNEDGESLCRVVESYSSVVDRLRELMEPAARRGGHGDRVAAMLKILHDGDELRKATEELVATARTLLETESIQSLGDVNEIVEEAAVLRQLALSIDHQTSEITYAESKNTLGTARLQSLVRDHRSLMQQTAAALELPTPQPVEGIVTAVSDLMRVLHGFESLASRHQSDHLPITTRVAAVVSFVDELRLLSQFAQNILDEEAEASVMPASHSSSARSLLSLRAALTRTPTPISDLPVASADVPPVDDDVPLPELTLSDDALAPTDADAAVCPSGALSDSLMDISLVMNDHHRILSEAAHWVGKAQSLSPRSKRPSPASSIDFAGELVRLVRDHCALLSLSKRLFRLQDPRQDLLSMLQCLAVLTRLSTRLRITASPGFMTASDSNESLKSTDDGPVQDDQQLLASLSVFAAMDDIARHLQDYDTLVARLLTVCRPLVSGDDEGEESGLSVDAVVDRMVDRLAMVDGLRVSLGASNIVDELPSFVEAMQTLARTDESGVDAVITSMRRAVEASDDLEEMLRRLRETLPFASTVESPQELMDHLKETLAQCDALITDKEEAWQRVGELEAQIDTMQASLREEDAVLSAVEELGAETRFNRIETLVSKLKELKQANAAMAAASAAEQELMQSAGYDAGDTLDSVRALVLAVDTLKQEKTELEAAQVRIQDAIAEERAFLQSHGVEWAEDEPRRRVYESLLCQLQDYRAWRQQIESDLASEVAFLTERGLPFQPADQSAWASRSAVYTTLLAQQSKLIDERVEQEIEEQQKRAQLEQELVELKATQQQQLDRQQEEAAFLQQHGLSPGNLAAPGARIHVYEMLLNREMDVKQQLAAWEGSPHSDAQGCRQADSAQQQAIAAAVAAAVEAQRQQLEFRQSVATADDEARPNESSKTVVELLEAVTKRDNAAVGMIYRLIRLVTDILNTSTFTASASGGDTLPVEHTQSVLGCVKELKSLKEFLLSSLEQITADHAAFLAHSPPPALARREAVSDHETAIDFAVLLHREHVASVAKALLDHDAKVKRSLATLRHALAGHADAFTDSEAHAMALEMEVAQAHAAVQTLETKLAVQDQFVQSFCDERKQVEAALAKALEEARCEQQELVKKMDVLAIERNDAMASALASGGTPFTPRTPLTAASRGGGSVVVPTRPERPRELTSSRIKTTGLGTGTAHKERFVSDLEKETGQRRTTAMSPSSAASQRRANEWKRHELLSSSAQMEQQFRAIHDEPTSNFLAISPPSRELSTAGGGGLSDQELWYQGVRLLHHVSFFVSVFFVPKQKTFRVEVFNSDSEQQQTIYVTLDEMRGFVAESRRAARLQITLEDATKHGEVVDVLFERIKVVGGDASNVLFAFQ